MDDLTAVRELAADAPPPTDEARSAARARLRRAVVQEGRPGALLSRRLMFRVAVAGTAAAAVAGGVVVATRSERDADGPRMATLSAAELLHRAADRTRADSAGLPIPRNDQYLYTKTYISRTYVEGGRRRTWTDESWTSVDGSKPSRRQEYGKVHHDPPLAEHEVMWPPTEYTALAKWPTDPDALLDRLRMGGRGDDRTAFMNAVQFFVVPRVMPPGLEAASFEAVARIPGIRIDRGVVDALGRQGIAVSYPESDFAFLFDTKSYAYLGLNVDGGTGEMVDGRMKLRDRYHELRARQETGVVDRIGQRP
ncbi:CU044_5270 family protein [Streptomyces justiciae]|nr:CU044_5270 family protein [Streptomyces justiciae]MCW8381809.1 CU044_5270 family protein [Streptomyces justiciae]